MPSFDQNNPADTLEDALDALQNAARTPARHRSAKISTLLDGICDHAFSYGLDSAQLHLVLDVVTRKTELDQTSITNLIKNLYPAQKVQNEAVTIIVGCLGQAKSKPTPATQASLVKWLITVYECLEDVSIISRLYGVLFSLLDMMSLRSHLCHLLALATRRKHVKPFRMQQLLELANNVGSEPALLRLATVYKDYYPDMILTSAIAGRAKAFVHPNPEWRDRLHSIQQANLRAQDSAIPLQNAFRTVKRGAKRSKVGEIPLVHTLHAQESSVTLEEISSVDDFVENLDRVDTPSQLIASLHDPLLQKFLCLRPSELSSQRIQSWLASHEFGYHDLLGDASYGRRQEDIINGILNFTSMTQMLPPGALGFMRRLLARWNGQQHCRQLLDCLGLLPLDNFEDFRESIVKPIETQLVAANSNAFTYILQFHANLARHLLLRITARTDAGHDVRSQIECFEQLVNHVLDVTLPILTMSPVPEPVVAAVIEFLEILVTPYRLTNGMEFDPHQQIPIILPQPRMIYFLFFDTSASNLSRLCSILATYKEALEKRRLSFSPPQQQIIGQFNGYLMDVCNFLWRSRAFQRDDSHALGRLLPESLPSLLQDYLETTDREYGLSYAFGLSHHSSLSSLSITAFRELEDLAEMRGGDLRVRHAGPVTQRSLMKLDKDGGFQVSWKDYRVQVLELLENHSLGGIKELMFSTMKDLFPKIV